MSLLVLLVLILLLLGAVPRWPHSRSWGWTPSGIVGFLLILFLVMWLLGYV